MDTCSRFNLEKLENLTDTVFLFLLAILLASKTWIFWGFFSSGVLSDMHKLYLIYLSHITSVKHSYLLCKCIFILLKNIIIFQFMNVRLWDM